MRVLWTARRSNQSILKEISPGCLLEGLMLMLKLKLQYFGHLMGRSNLSILREVNPEYSLEGLMLMLKLKLQYFGHLMQIANSLEKTLCWERLKAKGEEGSKG